MNTRAEAFQRVNGGVVPHQYQHYLTTGWGDELLSDYGNNRELASRISILKAVEIL